MANLKVKRAPQTESDQRAWETVYDDINDIIASVNQKSSAESRNGSAGNDGDIRLFKDVDATKYFIEGKFGDGWAKRELLFSDTDDSGQDESINYSSTENYIKPDGSVNFTAKVIGVSPAGGNTNHLATKGYVDTNATAFLLTGPVTGGTANAAGVATTIATDAIALGMMQNNSVSTNELVADSVTYAKMQNVTAQYKTLGRNSSGAGDIEELTPTQLAFIVSRADSASNDQSMFLSGSGIFREPPVQASNMHLLTDTAMISLGDGDIMSYENSTSLWKNRTRATIVRPQISASDPIAYNSTSGVISHATGAGKNHVPTGGSSGNFLKYSSSGVATWATPSYTTSLAHSAITNVGANDHHTRYEDNEAIAAINDTNSITTTCDSPDVNHHVNANWSQGTSTHAAYIQNKPTIQYTSAITLSELRSTLSYGNQGLVPQTGNAGEFLSYNGTFDEINVTLVLQGLEDTAFNNLADGHVLYKDGSFWKNLVSTGTGNNVRSASPTFTGTVNAATVTCSGELQATKIRLTSGTDAALNTINPAFMVGAGSGTNVAIDQNEVMARNNGSASQLHFNADGGGVTFFNNTADKKCEIDTAGSIIGKNLKAREDVIAYYNASDRRLKNNIETIPNALAKVMSLTGVTFKYKSDGKKSTGLIAQDLEKVLPEAVFENEEYKHIRYEIITGLLVEAIKELNNKGCCCGSSK